MTRKEQPTIKIYHYVIKRSYLNGKNTYMYERMFIPIPRMLQDKLISHRNQRLKIDITQQNNKIVIILDPGKTFLHTKTPPDKT
ncbi:MAG: hypothetical protein KGD70_16570 [Candidatus Lokiarchaeota archaeon]|nr:hypothetical protein [Candidatus Lokiarchaeota archaeon]